MSKKTKKATSKVASNFLKYKQTIIVSVLTLLIGFLGGASYIRNISKVEPYPQKAKVIRIIDGDTFELDNDKEFRLYGINCPEDDEPFFDEATEFTKNMTLNQKVKIEYEPNYKDDRYGRLLGYVTVGDKNLNVELVRNGLCKVVIYEKRAKLIYQDELLEAEQYAKNNKLGAW